MNPTAFILSLKQILPEIYWPRVAAALRRDPVIWESVQGEELGGKIFEGIPGSPEHFTPAALALLALNYPSPLETLRATPIQSIDPSVRQAAVAAAQAAKSPAPAEEMTLAQAGLLALQLRERRRVIDSWEGLAVDLSRSSPTVLACLYGMIPDSTEMLRAMLQGGENSDPEKVTGLALHAILCKPLSPEEQFSTLIEILNESTPAQQLAALKQLSAQLPELAARLAQQVDQQLPSGDLNLLIQSAEACHIADQPSQEILMLDEAIKAALRLQALLYAKAASASSRQDDPETALASWKQAASLDPVSPSYRAGLAQALIRSGSIEEAQHLLDETPENAPSPSVVFARARLAALLGDREKARQHAAQAASLVLIGLREPFISYPELANFLLNLHLPNEAAQIARLILEQQPNEVESLSLLSKACGQADDPAEALYNAHLAVALSPERLDLRRQLADSFEAAEEWPSALQERMTILERLSQEGAVSGSPETAPGTASTELRAMARCALRAGKPEMAIQACQKVLQIEPNDGLSFAFMGEAYADLGDFPAAIEHLQQAANQAPQHSDPWIALARTYQRLDQPQKALETLQTATRAAPELPEVHLALGEAYLEQNSPTQALSVLRRAADLANSSPVIAHSLVGKISLRLGQTLQRLGHLPEARAILEQAYTSNPSNPDLAYAYAQTLLSLGKQREAVTPLEVVLQSSPTDPEPYLHYARCLLALGLPPVPSIQPVESQPKPNGKPVIPSKQAPAKVQPAASRQKADAQAEEEIHLGKALPYLHRVLEIDPQQSEAKALLAETLAANGELQPALEAYRQAMETPLTEDPSWRSRLSLGLGRVALKIGQVETAIAALQEANQADPVNPLAHRLLSEAYDAAGLNENAFQAARAALLLAPDDLEMLTWFAEQALELQARSSAALPHAQSESIQALTRAVQLNPGRTDLILRLGQVQMQAGDSQSARATFSQLVHLEGKSPLSEEHISALHQAARSLLALGDAAGAIACLERALQNKRRRTDWTNSEDASQTPSPLLDLLTDLAAARYQAGKPQSALEALDQAVTVAPDDPGLYLDKANLHLEMGQSQLNPGEPGLVDTSIDHIRAALACLETALRLNPEDPALHLHAAQIQRATGDLSSALAHAVKALGSRPAASDQSPAARGKLLAARTLAADLARAQFQNKQACDFIHDPWQSMDSFDPLDRLDYYCLRAELALESGDGPSAADDLSALLDFAPEHPRVLAIQARLVARRGDLEVALQILRDAAEGLSQPDTLNGTLKGKNGSKSETNWTGIRGVGLLNRRSRLLNSRLSVAEACLELHRWGMALQILKQLATNMSLEPLFHLHLARALVLQAEFQSLCQALEVVRRAPGESAVSEEAYQSFTASIEAARKQVGRWKKVNSELTEAWQVIDRWNTRGQAFFKPGPESAQQLAELPLDPEDVAARVTCLNRIGDLPAAGIAARAYPQHPRVLVRLSLALMQEKPRQALAAAHAAAEALARPEAKLMGRSENLSWHNYVHKEDAPLIHALLARLVNQNGNRVGDAELAMQSIQTALAMWPDEPRWHALAAEIYLKCGIQQDAADTTAAESHLEQAIKLEPKYAPYYLSLGKIHFEKGELQQAIHLLEQSTRLAPDQAEPWALLAKAFQKTGDLEQAASRAEHAVTLAPDDPEPLLLRGEIALQAKNARGAQSRAQAALRLKPEDPTALLLLARAFSELDNPGEALAVIEKALPLIKEPLPFQIEHARLMLRSKGQEAALESLRELANNYPNEPSVLGLLAECLAEAGEREAAIHAAQQALRAERGSMDAQAAAEHANMHYLLGRLLHRSGQLDQAVHHLSEAIRHAPNWVEPYFELGITHQERRQFTQALGVFQQVIDAAPEDARGYYHAGLAYKENKDYISAEKMLRKAASLSPNDLGVHRLLAAVVAINLVHNRHEVGRETLNEVS